MGGTLILLALTLATLLWADLTNGYVWVVLLITLGFGVIGLADDYLKVTRRSSGGLRSRTKLLGQALVALMAAGWIAALTQDRSPPGWRCRSSRTCWSRSGCCSSRSPCWS